MKKRNINFYESTSNGDKFINSMINYLFYNNIINDNINIAEFGVGNGYLSKEILNNFSNIKYYTLDYLDKCLEKVDSKVTKKILVDLDQIKDFDVDEIKDNSLDIIFILDVLEHLRYPEYTLKLINKKLKKGGLIIASTPNINWYQYRLSFCLLGNDVEHFHNTNHVRYWNLKSFYNLISIFFKVKYHYTDFFINKPFSYIFLKNKLRITTFGKFKSPLFGYSQVIIAKKFRN